MSANKWRGEIAFPALGKNAFLSFPLEDLAELENQFGEDFFDVIEKGASKASPKVLPQVLAIGLKSRNAEGVVSKIWDDVGLPALRSEKFSLQGVGRLIMDAISISWLQKTYDQLIEEAVEARKKADAQTLERVKEAAEEAGIPLSEALSDGLFKLLTGQGLAPSTSGD